MLQIVLNKYNTFNSMLYIYNPVKINELRHPKEEMEREMVSVRYSALLTSKREREEFGV